MKIVFAALALVLAAILGASHATAQDVTLRVHHFMSSRAPLHANFLLPWADRLSEASDGRIKVEVFESMSLGGGPADLYGQAADGAVDIFCADDRLILSGLNLLAEASRGLYLTGND
ncbi:MAG: hypothetical protein AAFX98_06990, partial [Pseudomonadota bacterium]